MRTNFFLWNLCKEFPQFHVNSFNNEVLYRYLSITIYCNIHYGDQTFIFYVEWEGIQLYFCKPIERCWALFLQSMFRFFCQTSVCRILIYLTHFDFFLFECTCLTWIVSSTYGYGFSVYKNWNNVLPQKLWIFPQNH